MASSKAMTEDLISEVNGCGRYQIISTSIVLLSEITMVCSMGAMVFNGRAPDYWCIDQTVNASQASATAKENSSYNPLKTCRTIDDSDCSAFSFRDDFHTIVDEWHLVCDRKWIVAMVTTVLMAGVLLGCLVFGQISDTIGRKPTYFLSILCLVVLNIGARFSINWEMYAVISCLIGLAIGAFLVTRYVILVEFMSPVWQPRIMAIPAWPLSSCVYALFVWLLKDWRHVHLATAATGLPFLLTFCFLQESSRWQLTEQKFKDAERSINKIARTNGKPRPDLSKLFDKIKEERGILKGEKTLSHSPLDLFKTITRLKTTLGILFIWFSVSYSYYGLTFGVGMLAGDFYLNLVINNLVSVPSTVVVIFFLQRLGRRYSCVVSFILLGICGVISGAFRYIDISGSTMVVRVFSFAAKMMISFAWGCLAVYTNELYPTVVRSIAIGVCNVAAQTGAMLAPQTVFLGDEIPGLLYFPNAALNIISGLLCLMFAETRDSGLQDTLEITTIIKTNGSRGNKQDQDPVA